MKQTNFILIIIILFLVSACKKDTETQGLDVAAEIEKEIAVKGIPSVAACIVKDDKVVWEGTYGLANVKDQKPATNQTIYAVMSISKTFIAVSVMQLVEDGKLDLNQDINNYLPFEVRNPNHPDIPITVEMLLTHTSSIAWPEEEDGITDFSYLFPLDEMPLIGEWLPEYLLPGGSKYKKTVWKTYKPGEMELYSNIATSLSALIVEHVSGIDYRDYCQENILEPLEMYNSGFRYSKLDSGLMAMPYWNMSYPIHLYNFRHYPAGNLKSNLDDFSHYMIAMLNDGVYNGTRILTKASIEKMFELNNPSSGVSLIWRHCPGDCIGHSGGGEGFSARFELYPESKKAMIVFSNRFNESVYMQGRVYELLRYQCNKY